MAAPTIYKWTDPSAPQMTRNGTTDIQAIFQACLIDGYGSQTAPVSGTNKWSIPFSDATSFILKQGGTKARKTGVKFYGASTSGADNYMKVYAAADWTDLSTPVSPWTSGHSSERVAAGSASVASYNIPWIIIATERAIFVQFGYNNQQTNTTMFDTAGGSSMFNGHFFFGDYIPEDNGLLVNQMLTISYYASTSYRYYCENFTYQNSTKSYGYKVVAGNTANVTGINECEIMHMRPGETASTVMGLTNADQQFPGYPNGLNGGLYLDIYRIVSNRSIMGVIPGLMYSIQSRPFNNYGVVQEIAGTGTYAGETIYIFGDYNATQYYIHDGEWGVE